MSVQFKSGVTFLLASALLLTDALAEDVNFGKSKPSTENVIEQFKVNPSETDNSGQPEETSSMPGVKTRGLKKIGMGHPTAKPDGGHNKVQPSQTEKAISLEVLFDYNSANLTSEAKLQLVPVGGAMASEELKGLRYRIEGHTDVVGGDEFNIELSRRRAEAVKQFLIDQYGLSASAIEIVGKGKSDLADKANPTSEANRRVRIVRLGN